ncbi:DNA replication and repair protein RecN [Balneicella halophila]|uniref:DNA repair protein RecN n=1 Tax=Balneicella halophila TaxID=1537566 RepID=A0A7L4URZ6_BALHA|nr:DNA repair protein RecN [Balneicella halophila]PVX52533.1 DNA replication and repair protein RecN [Balneicella halophila]
MLQSLHIQNYALIEALTIAFDKGFVVLTGETGAGKSIILGALGLLLGERANLSSIGDPKKKCIVEGEFSISNYDLSDFFTAEDIDYEDITLIRRELSPTGKSRAFINDTPVRLNVLKEFTSKLIDIHSQHQNLQIENEAFQFQLVDNYSKNKKVLSEYQKSYRLLQELKKKKATLLESQRQQSSDIDYWQFQLEELISADLKDGEQEQLEQENTMLSQMESIINSYSEANDYFNSDLTPIENIRKLASNFQKLEDVHNPSKALGDRLESVYIELKDIISEILVEAERLQNDPKRAIEVSERLDTIYRLQQKHGKDTIAELLQLEQELQEKVNAVHHFDEHLAKIENELESQMTQTSDFASQLSKSRKKAIPKIEKQLTEQLQRLGMPHAKILIGVEPTNEFKMLGKETIYILFSTNKNTSPAPISDVASGGELSRLMLSIKQLMAKSMVLPTLIFDEIDSGVSGEIASKMGDTMHEMAQQMQVIAITHLPQIAAKANQHWQVYKKDTSDKTLTSITKLDADDRTVAIAKMLSGRQLTSEAIANARALLSQS